MTYGRSKRQVGDLEMEICSRVYVDFYPSSFIVDLCIANLPYSPNGINRLKVLAFENNISAFKTLIWHWGLFKIQIAHFLVELTKSKLPIEEIRRMNLYVE